MKLKELYKKVRMKQEVSLDEHSMWEAIESRLEQPKKKRRFIWLWFIMGILFIGACLSVFHGLEYSTEQNIISDKSRSKSTIPVNSIPVSTPQILDDNTLKNNEVGESNHIDTDGAALEIINPTVDLKPHTTADVFEIVDDEVNNSTIIGIKLLEEANKNIKVSPVFSIANNKQSTIRRKGNNRHKSILTSVPTISYSKIEGEKFLLSLGLIPKVDALTKSANLGGKDNNVWRDKLEFAISLDILQPSNSYVEKDPLVPSWGELHNSSKTSNMSFQLSTILKYRHGSGIGIGSGIIVRQISEWYDATVETTTPYSMPSDSAKFATVNGVKTFAKGLLTGTKMERTSYHTPVRRLYFDLPLEVSYAKSWNRLDVELFMSYNFNFSHHYYGRSYADDQVLLDQDQLNLQGVYKSSFVNSTNVGLKLYHHLTSNVSVGLSLNYWRQLSSSLDSSSSVDEHYGGFGGGLSVKRTFTQ